VMLAPLFLSVAQRPGAERAIFTPQVPTADRAAGNRVFLEHADVLRKVDTDSFMILVGNVFFTKGPMYMYCDSCHYYPDTESMEAFGNVRMEQGDTLFVYADELVYDGRPESEIATLYADDGKKVRLINKDVQLETDVFIYDLKLDLGYYNVGGVLTDASNRLTSLEGEYMPSTKEANFYTDVHLNSRSETDTLDIYTDTLYYNTNLHLAELNAFSTIINARGTIYTRRGVYLTDSNICTLTERPLIVTNRNQTLVADSVYYNHNVGFAEAFGDMVLTDSANCAQVCGEYGFYDEIRDSSYVTGRALIREYSQGDTLFLHGRQIESFIELDTTIIAADTIAGTPESFTVDTCHIMQIYPRVRFFRSDLQGVCDSMRFTQRDSMLRMYVNPVVWSEGQQIFGNLIEIHLNDSTFDRARLPEFGFAAQEIEGDCFNQIAGKEMIAYFVDRELRHIDINGNVEIIMYPQESDSTVNKIVNAESSFLSADFNGRTTERIKMWPETNGTATPLFMA
ncbi:MAG: hypothetical protein K2I89_05420, partial [Muribaculaceae bacterium]|nr:hypothetical protein [Muribaculaceae bacterium]